MTDGAPDPLNEAALTRARRDFWQAAGSGRAALGVAALTLVTIASLLAFSGPGWLILVASIIGGPLLFGLLGFGWFIARTPYLQRDEALGAHAALIRRPACDAELVPLGSVNGQTEVRIRVTNNSAAAHTYEARVTYVENCQTWGGPEPPWTIPWRDVRENQATLGAWQEQWLRLCSIPDEQLGMEFPRFVVFVHRDGEIASDGMDPVAHGEPVLFDIQVVEDGQGTPARFRVMVDDWWSEPSASVDPAP